LKIEGASDGKTTETHAKGARLATPFQREARRRFAFIEEARVGSRKHRCFQGPYTTVEAALRLRVLDPLLAEAPAALARASGI
jgi:hypothetical protein